MMVILSSGLRKQLQATGQGQNEQEGPTGVRFASDVYSEKRRGRASTVAGWAMNHGTPFKQI